VAIFGFIDAALIKPLPYRDPSRLVSVSEANRTGLLQYPLSYLDYRDWKNLNNVFSSMDAYDANGGFTLSSDVGPALVSGTRVSTGFFRTLGIDPVLGRDFRADEDSPSAPETVVLSYAAWQERFGGRHDVLGQAVTLNGAPSTIIGVLPPDFYFAPTGAAEFWRTLRESGGTLGETSPCEQKRGCHNLNAVARLKDGVSTQMALAEMKAIAQQLEKQYPESNRDQSANVMFLSDAIIGNVRPILLTLLSGVGLLLLIACINVASLLLARSNRRKREIAVRSALGASSGRLFVQFATEGLVLAAIGSVLGLLAAQWAIGFLTKLIPAGMIDRMPYLRGLGLNSHMLALSCAIAVIATALFAVAPILGVSLSERMEGLKEANRGSSGRAWRHFGANFVVVELTIAMVLLVAAGLLGKSLDRLLHQDVGLDPGHLATLEIEGPLSNYANKEQDIALERQIIARISGLPSVRSVGVSNRLPVGQSGGTVWFRVLGRPDHGEHNEVFDRQASSSYFTALQARLLRGRYFDEVEDASKPPVVIINQTMANQYFPGEDPVGKQIFFILPQQPPMQIVGVVADIKEGPLDAKPWPALYAPFNQNPSRFFCIVVRTSLSEQSLLRELRLTVHQIDSEISIYHEGTMTDRIKESPSAYLHRSSAWLVGTFATIALLLSVVGLYGIVAYSVSQRTREIGVRMALGAQRSSVYQLVLKEATRLTAAGVGIGLACAVAAGTLMRGLLFGVRSWDVPTLAAVAAVLGISALLASYIPARRAASVDPVEALRAE